MDKRRAGDIVQIMSEASVGGGFALVVEAFPQAAALAGFLQPAAEYMGNWGARRMTDTAVDESGLSEQAMFERLAQTTEGLQLIAAAVEAARATVHLDKLDALGRSLAAGVATGAALNEEILLVSAIADMEPQHIRLLQVIASVHSADQEGWSGATVVNVEPDLTADVFGVLIGRLSAHGAVVAESGYGLTYRATPFGVRVLDRVARAS